MHTLGHLFRAHREKHGLLLRQAAAVLHIDQGLLSKIERGERMPTQEQTQSLAELYNLNADELLADWKAEKILALLQGEKNKELIVRKLLQQLK